MAGYPEPFFERSISSPLIHTPPTLVGGTILLHGILYVGWGGASALYSVPAVYFGTNTTFFS